MLDATAGLNRSRLPEPVLHTHPELVDLYWVAWQLAGEHVVEREGVPRSPYLDEGFDPETIWIWDTCFMAHFAKYAPDLFPGVESLENFYRPMYDGVAPALKIQHPDNPPLFAWSEEEYVRHTGDLDRVRWLLQAGYLQQQFSFFDAVRPGTLFPWSRVPTQVERVANGYRWNGVSSGMDNTPRAPESDGHGNTVGPIMWFDAAAQQALSALSIARLAKLVGDDQLALEYEARHRDLIKLVDYFWDAEDRFYYDRFDFAPYTFHRVRTPAAYWPLLAGACTSDQAATLAAALQDPQCFGGPVPWASVARNDPAFRGSGHYWRGGVWVPTAYLSARALADAGYGDLARQASLSLLGHMARTYAEYEPATIWECYAPARATPATAKDDDEIVRPDFCGWSALAPIAMMIEHVLGFRVDAPNNTVRWRTATGESVGTGRRGIRRLRCGSATVDAIIEGSQVVIDTNRPITFEVDGRVVDLAVGRHEFSVDSGRGDQQSIASSAK